MNDDTDADPIGRYFAAIKVLSEWHPSKSERAQELRAQAVSYVWGWQDAGGELKDSERASNFSWAYGTVAALFEIHGGARPPIQDAWKSWMQYGEIRDYDGRALDRVSPLKEES
jgi:hypothetical protein